MQMQHPAIIVCSVMILLFTSLARANEQSSPPAPKGAAQAPVINVGLSRVPKLGFRSTFGDVGGARGELIRQVQLGSPADRMKLLPGDVIVAVNGAPLANANSWFTAVNRALSRDGWVTLKIRAARTGAIEYRTVNLLKLPAKW